MSLSKPALDWLTIALDPFHDTVTDLYGYPDTSAANTFVSCVKQTTVISAPAGQTTPWSFNVSITPFTSLGGTYYAAAPTSGTDTQIVTGSGNATGFTIQDYWLPSNTSFPYGPIVGSVQTTAAFNNGNTLLPFFPFGAALAEPVFAFGETTGTPCRLIAMGFEVTDVTPVLEQQGTVTAYRSDYSCIDDFRWNGWADAGRTNLSYSGVSKAIIAPPGTSTQALTLPNTIQYAAKLGCYYVAKFQNVTAITPAPRGLTNNPIIQFQQSNDDTDLQQGGIIVNAGGISGMCPGGVFFEGLNPTSGSFRLTVRLYYEYFPVLNSDPLLPLASPSCPYEPQALYDYSKAVMRLPVACKVTDNASGDWFRRIAGAVTKVGSLLPGAVGVAARFANARLTASAMPTNTVSRSIPAVKTGNAYDTLMTTPNDTSYPAYPGGLAEMKEDGNGGAIYAPNGVSRRRRRRRRGVRTTTVVSMPQNPPRRRRQRAVRVTTRTTRRR